MENFNKNWISLSSEKLNVVRDEHGVPIEWTLLKVGDNPLCQEGIDGNLHLTSENMANIVDYFTKKGELIPIDIPNRKLELEVSDEVIAERRAKFVPKPPKFTSGYLAKYAALATSADTGGVLKIK